MSGQCAKDNNIVLWSCVWWLTFEICWLSSSCHNGYSHSATLLYSVILSLEVPNCCLPANIQRVCQSINGWWTNYWVLPTRRCNMSHFKCQHARNWKFFSRQNYLKKPLATQISRSNACRLLSLGPIEGQSVQKFEGPVSICYVCCQPIQLRIMYYIPSVHNNISVLWYNIHNQVTVRLHVSTVNGHLQANEEHF